MGYEHNDIAIMGGLRAALEEESPMFERNDIVTVYKMNEAIAEGGGGGGDCEFYEIPVTHVLPDGKTLDHYAYTIITDGGSIGCMTNENINTILLDGESEILIGSGTSDLGDYLVYTDISVSGDIEVDPNSPDHIYVFGTGSVTISWRVV